MCVHCKVISHSVVDSKLFWFASMLTPCWVTATDNKSELCVFQSVVFSQILFVAVFCGLVLLWFGFEFPWGCSIGREVVLEKWILPQFLKLLLKGSVAFIACTVLSRQLNRFGQEGLVSVVLGCGCRGWVLRGVSEYRWSHVGQQVRNTAYCLW